MSLKLEVVQLETVVREVQFVCLMYWFSPMDVVSSISEGEKPIAVQGVRMVQHSKHSFASWDQFIL